MKNKSWVTAVAGVVLLGSVMQATQAFSLKDLLGMGEEEATEQPEEAAGDLMGAKSPVATPAVIPTDQNWGKPSGNVGKAQFDVSNVQRILENVDASQRTAVLSDEAAFKRFVQQETDAASLLQAARSNNLQADPNVAFLMQRGSDNVLREVYLARLIAGKIPAGFPTEEQLKKYFEDNKAKLVVPERVQVWQVYFPFEKNMDAKARTALMQKADSIAKDLKEKRISFADAAEKYSRHESSRGKGGDMGLVSTSDLKPGVKEPLLALPEGQISAPIKTDAGIHILMRGAKTAPQPLEYGAIKDQLRQIMLKQARLQLRNAILDQARKTYPVELEEKKIEELRLRLRTDLVPGNAKPTPSKPST